MTFAKSFEETITVAKVYVEFFNPNAYTKFQIHVPIIGFITNTKRKAVIIVVTNGESYMRIQCQLISKLMLVAKVKR